jgi:VIT1/CCC1 family predicted Fe2+/Mn2+ transporter
MPIILDRLDGELLERLTDLAKARNVSVEDQIVTLLGAALPRSANLLRARAEAIAAMTPKGVKQTDSTILIREDRDR